MARTPFPMRTDAYTAKRYGSHAEWLAGRARTVGASEVAMVMGIAPSSWGTAVDLWNRKRNPPEETGNKDTRRGSDAEEHIRALLQIENPDLRVEDGTGVIFRSRKFPWLSCSLDAMLVNPDGSFAVVEIKDVRYTPKWKDGAMPIHYLYQCAAQMLVTGANAAILYPRIFYDFSQERDRLKRLCARTVRETPMLIRRSQVKGQFAGIVRETKEFHDCLESGTPPPVRMGRR